MKNLDHWWEASVIYQVYPRSFQDSNGDGNGDLRGIESQLDYLQWLGVTAIWVSVFYQSPHVDGGYDVSDYEAVDPLYGTMEEMESLIRAVHDRGMRIIVGLVPNHTSDEHPWFLDSRSGRDSAHADWYHWRDAAPNGGVPNNWLDALGNSAWTWCPERRQFYYHAYFPQQPDLNWRNPDVREAMFGVMRFWLDRGVDGFRIDVLWRLMKDRLLRNNPPNASYDRSSDQPRSRLSSVFSANQPDIDEVIAGMRSVADEYGDRLLVGEVDVSTPSLMKYYANGHGAQLPFNFILILKKWEGPQLMQSISRYFAELPHTAWPNWVLGNHDQKRVASREGDGGARLGAVLLFTLGGTPFVYNGDEIGMQDVDVPRDQMHDPMARASPKFARDPERTPMQWSAQHAAGFTTGEPWLPVGPDFGERNVEKQRSDRQSILHLYRDLIALRARETAILSGDYVPLRQQGDWIAYLRQTAEQRFLVVANLGQKDDTFGTDEIEIDGVIAISTDRSRDEERVCGHVAVGARGAVVVRLG